MTCQTCKRKRLLGEPRLPNGWQVGSDPFARRCLWYAAKERCGHEWLPRTPPEPGDEPHIHRCRRSKHRPGTMHTCSCGGAQNTKGLKLGG